MDTTVVNTPHQTAAHEGARGGALRRRNTPLPLPMSPVAMYSATGVQERPNSSPIFFCNATITISDLIDDLGSRARCDLPVIKPFESHQGR